MGRFSVRYASSRAEVWRAYWRAWASRGVWRFHAGLAVLVGVIAALRGLDVSACLADGAAAFALCLVVFPLLSQLMFKPAMREFTIDATGWQTRIGAQTATRAWREVRTVADAGDLIEIIGVNGNSMLVPRRAFADGRARAEFLAAAVAWHAAAQG